MVASERDGLARWVLLLLLAVSSAEAHMSIWTRSMYGVADGMDGSEFVYSAGDPVSPIGPDLKKQDDWWFRGPSYRALSPEKRRNGTVTELPAGGKVDLEIACNVAWTSFRPETATKEGSALDACPDNPGAYHSGDPAASTIDNGLLSGCAIGLADVDDIEDVTMDNLAIISVQSQCVKQKVTTFEMPRRLPACTGKKCICAWFWLANNGTVNFYMTAFDCTVTNSPSNALAIAPPVDPVYCPRVNSSCTPTRGAKRPLYAYNEPSNVAWYGNDARPGYHSEWSFEDGAQEDIYVGAIEATSDRSSTAEPSTSTESEPTQLVVIPPTRLGASSPSSTLSSLVSSDMVTRTRTPHSVTSAMASTTTTSLNSTHTARPTASSLIHSRFNSTTLVLSTTSRNRTSTLPHSPSSRSSLASHTRTSSSSSTSVTHHVSSTGQHSPSPTRRVTTTRLTTLRRPSTTSTTIIYQSTGGTGLSQSTQTAKTRILGSLGSALDARRSIWAVGVGLAAMLML